jgi:PAS domain S-box-containing protein
MDWIGTTINGKYKIIEKIKEDYLFLVFLALDLKNEKKENAITVLKPSYLSQSIEDQVRYKKDMEAAIHFCHSNVIKVCETGEAKNFPYIVTEHLNGDSLSDLFKIGKSFNIGIALDILVQAAEGLKYLHSQNVLHRDLRPSNIFLRRGGEGHGIKLMNFALPSFLNWKEIKKEEGILENFGYLSPETTGMLKKEPDERSDLYSLGIICYQLLTGEYPYSAKGIAELLHQHTALYPRKPCLINNDIPPILEEIVFKLINKDPESRYQSADGLLYDIKRLQSKEEVFILGEKDQKKKISPYAQFEGREPELQKISSLLNIAKADNGTVCMISGEAGSGKTRLLEEIKRMVALQGGLVIGGRCTNQQNKPPFQPFQEALDAYIKNLEYLDSEAREQEISRIKNRMGNLSQIVIRFYPGMRQILGEVKDPVYLDPDRENQRFTMVLSELFHHLAGDSKPYLFYIEDLHWADESTMHLFREMTHKINGSNMLLIATCRKSEMPKENLINMPMEKIDLNPFELKELRHLTASILGEKEEFTEKITAYLMEKTGGNPLFFINFLINLVKEKTLIWKDGHWEEDWDKIKKITAPESMIDIILKRIRNLPEKLYEMLSLCSAIGREFEIELLVALGSFKQEEMIRLIDEAISLQLLEKYDENGKKKVAFIHNRIWETFYEKMEINQKKILHAQIAEFLEKRHLRNEENVLYNLVYHYEKAENKNKTLEYIIPLADQLKYSYAHEEALHYYLAGIKALEEQGKRDSEEWGKACKGLSEVYLSTGRNDEAIEIAFQLLPLKKTVIEKAEVYSSIGKAYFKKGDWANCEKMIAEGLSLLGEKIPLKSALLALSFVKELFIHLFHNVLPKKIYYRKKASLKKEDLLIQWFYVTLNWAYILSDTYKLIVNQLRMLNLSERRLGISGELGMSLGAYGSICMAIPLFKRAIRYHSIALKMRKDLGDDWGIAQSLQWMGYCYCWKGEYQKSIDYFKESLERFQKIGDLWEIVMAKNGLGFAYLYSGNFHNSLAAFQECDSISNNIKDFFGMGGAQQNISLCLIEAGNLEEAEKAIKKSLSISRKAKDWFTYCAAHLSWGYLKLEQKDVEKAIEYLEIAEKLERKNSFLKDFVVLAYPLLAEAYLEKAQVIKDSPTNQKTRKKIKNACKTAIQKTKSWPNHYGRALLANAKYYAFLGKIQKAEKYFQKSIEYHQKLGRRFETARSFYEKCLFLKVNNKKEAFQYNLSNAYRIFKDIGARSYVERCEELLTQNKENYNNQTDQTKLNSERKINILTQTIKSLNSILELKELMTKTIDFVIEMLGAQRGIILVYPEEDKNTIEMKVVRNVSNDYIDNESGILSKSIIEKVKQTKKSLVVEDAISDEQFKAEESVIVSHLRSVLCVPILIREKMAGIIYLENSMVSKLFSKEDLEILGLIADHLGMMIENARLYGKLENYSKNLEKKVEERTSELKKSEERFKEMALLLPTIIIETDMQINITFLNEAGLETFGFWENDFKKNAALPNFIHPGDKEKLLQYFNGIVRNEESNFSEFRFVQKEGINFTLLCKATPIYKNSLISGVRWSAIDIKPLLSSVIVPKESFFKNYKFSPREKETFLLLLQGYKIKEIAKKLQITESTVKDHIGSIYEEMGVKNRAELFNTLKDSNINYFGYQSFVFSLLSSMVKE